MSSLLLGTVGTIKMPLGEAPEFRNPKDGAGDGYGKSGAHTGVLVRGGGGARAKMLVSY
jgi:hypothetical protein